MLLGEVLAFGGGAVALVAVIMLMVMLRGDPMADKTASARSPERRSLVHSWPLSPD